jgi:hypothetical protein
MVFSSFSLILLISVIKYIGFAILFLIEENHFIAFVFASIVLTRNFLTINKISVQSLGYVFS